MSIEATVEPTDRTSMADSGDRGLDEMFELLERMPVPEGYKAEIVEGAVQMSPQRRTHWAIIESVLLQLKDRFGRLARTESDVRLDLPGYRNGFAPDLIKIADDAEPDQRGQWHFRDVQFVLEVISRETAANDYGRKKNAYAAAHVPVYVIADPYTGKCHAFGRPEKGAYESELTVAFGEKLDLSPLGFSLVLASEDFPRD